MPAPKDGGYHDGQSDLENYAHIAFYDRNPRLTGNPLVSLDFGVYADASGNYRARLDHAMISLAAAQALEARDVGQKYGPLNWLPHRLGRSFGPSSVHPAGSKGREAQEVFIREVRRTLADPVVEELRYGLKTEVWMVVRTSGCHEGTDVIDFAYGKVA